MAKAEIVEEVLSKLIHLPEDKLREVLDFVDFLNFKEASRNRGSAEAILSCFGTWKFEAGEWDEIEGFIQMTREMNNG